MRRMGRRGLCRCCPDAPAGKGMAGVWHGTPCAARNRKNAPPPGTAAGRQSVCEGAILCYAALRAAGKRGRACPALFSENVKGVAGDAQQVCTLCQIFPNFR